MAIFVVNRMKYVKNVTGKSEMQEITKFRKLKLLECLEALSFGFFVSFILFFDFGGGFIIFIWISGPSSSRQNWEQGKP